MSHMLHIFIWTFPLCWFTHNNIESCRLQIFLPSNFPSLIPFLSTNCHKNAKYVVYILFYDIPTNFPYYLLKMVVAIFREKWNIESIIMHKISTIYVDRYTYSNTARQGQTDRQTGRWINIRTVTRLDS